MNRPLLGCILFALSLTASAAGTALYKVELIVFENLDPGAPQAEDWPADSGMPPLDNAMELSALPAPAPLAGEIPVSADTPVTVIETIPAPETATSASQAGAELAAPTTEPEAPSSRWMAKSELSLDEDEQKLLNSGRYRPLLHIGWVQPLDATDQGTPVHIYDGMKPADDVPALGADTEGQVVVHPLASPSGEMPAPATPKPVKLPPPQTVDETHPTDQGMPRQGRTPHVLDGTFTLRQGRYLHVDVDLGYRLSFTPEATLPADARPGDATVQPVARLIRMTQSRRIRSDELNYLDHPLIGVLFVVSPYLETPANTPKK